MTKNMNHTIASDFEHLLPPAYRDEVKNWINSDCPTFDVGGYVVGEKEETAYLLCKGDCYLAGVPFANAVFDYLDLQYKWNFNEGSFVDTSQGNNKVTVATVYGNPNFDFN